MFAKHVGFRAISLFVLLAFLLSLPAVLQAQDDMDCMVDESITGTLTFLGHPNHPMDNVRDAFSLCYPNVEMDWQYADDHGTRFTTAMAAGTGAPDLYWAEADIVQQYGSQGVLLDVSDVIAENSDLIVAGKLAEAYVASADAYYGMPGDLSSSGIYYNAAELEALGIEIPENMTYEQFLTVLDDIAAAGKNAIVLPNEPATLGMAYYSWFNAAYGGYGPVACDNSEVLLNDEASVSAVTLLRDIVDTGATLEVDWLSAEYWEAISSGQLVMAMAASWERGFWESNIDESQLGNWRLIPLPRATEGGPNSGVFGGATLISPASTESPELVKLFMDFFASTDGARAAADWGIIPSYIPYLEGEFQEEDTLLFGDQNIAEIFLSMDTGANFCRTGAFGSAVLEFLVPELNTMIRDDADIQSTLDFVAEDFDAILIDYQN